MDVLPPFWTLVETHGDELLVHARRLAGDDQAEDVLQDALLRALRAYPQAAARRPPARLALPRDHLGGDGPSPLAQAGGGDRRAARRATHDALRRRRLRGLIEPLNETARTALRLRFVDDLDYDGIADALGCSTVAARQRVSTAVRTLRESFA